MDVPLPDVRRGIAEAFCASRNVSHPLVKTSALTPCGFEAQEQNSCEPGAR